MPKEKQLTAMQSVMTEIEMDNNNGVEISQKILWGMLNKALATERQQLIDAVNYGGNYYDGTKLMSENYYNNTFKTK